MIAYQYIAMIDLSLAKELMDFTVVCLSVRRAGGKDALVALFVDALLHFNHSEQQPESYAGTDISQV